MTYNKKQYTVELSSKAGKTTYADGANVPPTIDLIQSARYGRDLSYNGTKIPFDSVNYLEITAEEAVEVDKGEGFCVD